MARKKIDEGSLEEQKKVFLCRRISQIRQTFFADNNRSFSEKTAVNEQALSQICSGKRNAGIEIVQKILDNMPEINANWLMTGLGNMTDNSSQRGNVGENNGIIVQHGGGGDTYNNQINSELMQIVKSQQQTIQELTEQNKILTQIIKEKI